MQHVAKRRQHRLRFALAQQTVIDEDAGELLADRARDQRRRDGRIDAAGERADDLVVADLRRESPRSRGRRTTPSSNRRPSPAIRCRKLASIVRAGFGVHDFGMKLHAVDLASAHRPSRRRCSARVDASATKPARKLRRPNRRATSTRATRVGHAVRRAAIPRSLRSQRRRAVFGVIELAPVPRRDGAPSAACRSRCRESAARSARSPDRDRAHPATSVLSGPPERMIAAGLRAASVVHGDVVGNDLAVDAEFARPARDQLAILRAEVEDKNRRGHRAPFRLELAGP